MELLFCLQKPSSYISLQRHQRSLLNVLNLVSVSTAYLSQFFSSSNCKSSLTWCYLPSLSAFLMTCRSLTELALLYCQRIGNSALLEVGRGCKFLQALHLVDCSNIGDEAIGSIARGCQNLKKLHIRRCYKVLSHLKRF